MITIYKRMIWMICFVSISSVSAQTLLNGFFPKQKELTIASSYSFKSYNNFYIGETLSDTNPMDMGEISSSILSIYGEYGVLDWLSTTVTIPYVSTKNETGILDPVLEESQVEGVQDLSFFLKAKVLDKKFSNASKLSLGGATGVTLPVGGYEEAGILSIGSGATAYEGCGFLQYQTSSNLFIELQAAYSLRNNPDFEIPNAMVYSAKLGYYNKWFYTHAKIGVQNSLSGFDIGSQEFVDAGGPNALPETEVDYANFYFDIYVPIYKQNFGISSGYAVNVDGKNYDNASSFSVGLVYKTN
ncbi:transporter [Aquimarina sp. BL5]|nr:transporter [Aquimarina sp. BL5]